MRIKARRNFELYKNTIFFSVVLFLFLFISVGYSVLSTNLEIDGSAKVLKYEEPVIENTWKKDALLDTNIDFSKVSSATNGRGLYIRSGTENDENPIYYFRGDVSNNNVLFGGFCWKIIRSTENGGTKLLYSGTPTNGECNNTGNYLSIRWTGLIHTTRYNPNAKASPSVVGYTYIGNYEYEDMSETKSKNLIYGNDVTYDSSKKLYTLSNIYNTSGGQKYNDIVDEVKLGYHYACYNNKKSTCETVYYMFDSTQGNFTYYELSNGDKIDDLLEYFFTTNNTVDSSAKERVDEWYQSNMTAYTSKLEDAIYCNDRTIFNKAGFDKDTDADQDLLFSAYDRVVNKTGPSLNCIRNADRYTVSSSNGNGKLTYPVGLITADEAVLAGFIYDDNSTDSYIKMGTGVSTWTMTPLAYGTLSKQDLEMFVIGGRSLDTNLRPVVTLNNSIVFSSGNGTSNTPYIVN